MVAGVLVLSITFIANSLGANDTIIPVTGSGNSSEVTAQSNIYTMTDVAQHNNASSCWFAVGGNVYDGTSWIPMHPGGGQAILSLCGTDGTGAFENQHGDQRRPAQGLASLQIGTLAQ